MNVIKYRLNHPGLQPRQTKLQIPGWAGEHEPRRNGSHEHVWHCLPFTEGAQYGIEVFYPYNHEVIVSAQNGSLRFDGDFGDSPHPEIQWPPFRDFGKKYYTYQLLLDLKVPEGFAVRTEPHPRFYTDSTYTTPIAVPALVRRWWPMMFFIVFKSPPEGQRHIFRFNEPFAQIIVVPEPTELTLEEMPEEEAAEREMQSRRIYESRATLGKQSEWVSASRTVFDGTYRNILREAKAMIK